VEAVPVVPLFVRNAGFSAGVSLIGIFSRQVEGADCLPVISALTSCLKTPVPEVQIHAVNCLMTVLLKITSIVEVWPSIISEFLPRFYKVTGPDFFNRVAVDVLERNWEQTSGFILDFAGSAILCPSPDISNTAIAFLERIIGTDRVYDTDNLIRALEKVCAGLPNLNVANGTRFVKLVEKLSPVIHREVVRLLEIGAQACKDDFPARKILCARCCASIARAVTQSEFQPAEIGECFAAILRRFLDSGIADGTEGEPALEWSNAVSSALRIMLGLDGFQECFRATGELLLLLVARAPKAVRTEVGRVIQKQLSLLSAS
jgi:hypothetical protein